MPNIGQTTTISYVDGENSVIEKNLKTYFLLLIGLVFALIFGYIFLNEVLTTIQWFGVFLTLISIYLINQRENIGTNQKPTITDTNTTPTQNLTTASNSLDV